MCEIIGRKNEIAELKRCYNSGRAEFVAVYGRRRVGKTFLVNELFHDDVVFHHTGLSPYDRQRRVSTKDQLQNFYFSLIRHGMEGISQPKSWLEAFFLLEKFLDINENGSRQVVFIDELPWMDTARSAFSPHWRLSGMVGATPDTTLCSSCAGRLPPGCWTISSTTREGCMAA